MKISIKNCTADYSDSIADNFYQKSVLSGEIEGLETIFFELKQGEKLKYEPDDHTINTFIFLGGKGKVLQNDKQFSFDEVALLVAENTTESLILSDDQNFRFLQLKLALSPIDTVWLTKQQEQNRFPFFVLYSKAGRYTESIKSAKTINRILLPEDVVPRLCIGSVETTGPDEIGEHSHAMLEQMFLGLSGNNCIVKADNTRTVFKTNDLLHIPLGSTHGVTVKENRHLNYIWIDLFKSLEDTTYIKENHFDKED